MCVCVCVCVCMCCRKNFSASLTCLPTQRAVRNGWKDYLLTTGHEEIVARQMKENPLYISSVVQQPKTGLGRLIFEVSR
jgi:hypothetical protein